MVGQRGTFETSMFEEAPLSTYLLYLTANGITEGHYLFDKIPFQYNLDLLKGVCFSKGCYLGQELVSRAYHTGVVRKRIFPFVLKDKTSTIPVDSVLKAADGRTLGKVVHSDSSIGLGLIDYLSMVDLSDLQFVEPQEGMIMSPYQE